MENTVESPPKGTLIANVIAVSPAAVANHFSWRRSSPVEPLNRTTVDANDVRIVSGTATIAMMNRTTSAVFTGPPPVLPLVKGSFHDAVAVITATASSMPNRASVKISTGRHFGEGTRPVGNQRNRSTKALNGSGQSTFESQPARFPPGRDPGSTRRACAAYAPANWPIPRTSPTRRNNHPIRFSGRRMTSNTPRAGVPRFTAASRIDDSFHDWANEGRLAFRSMNSMTRPPTMSAVEATPTTTGVRRTAEEFTDLILPWSEPRREPWWRELRGWWKHPRVPRGLTRTLSYGITRYRCQRSGTPFSSCSPASSKERPLPATRSFTVLDTRTSE